MALCFSNFQCDSNAFKPKVYIQSIFLHKVQHAVQPTPKVLFSSQISLNLHYLHILDESNINRNNLKSLVLEVSIFFYERKRHISPHTTLQNTSCVCSNKFSPGWAVCINYWFHFGLLLQHDQYIFSPKNTFKTENSNNNFIIQSILTFCNRF